MKNRDGAYKKILLDPPLLKENRDYLTTNMLALKQLSLSGVDLTTLYLLLFLRIKHPINWLQKKSHQKVDANCGTDLLTIIPETFKLTNWEKEKLKGMSTFDLFCLFNLKGIPESINRTMRNWFLGLWKIEMLEYIPNSRELLKLQVKNTRCITLITGLDKIDELVLGARDPLSFALHDLMHADQFFNQNDSLKGQLGFYQLVDKIYDQPLLRSLLKSNKEFKKEFEYVVSDMNAYVIHLFKCLKSTFYRTEVGSELFNLLLSWWNMNEAQKNASLKLNTPEFSLDDEMILKTFFENNQEILP